MNKIVLIFSTAASLALVPHVSLAKEDIMKFAPWMENIMKFDPWMEELKQKIGYEEAIRNERRDGLILIDFRKIEPPLFATQWPEIKDPEWDNWNFSKGDYEGVAYSHFDWEMEGELEMKGIKRGLSASIVAYVSETYEGARAEFFSHSIVPRVPYPWVPCRKKIGTICAAEERMVSGEPIYPEVFFTYKNVYIKIVGSAEVVAEWLFEELKKHPLSPMLPPGPLVRGKAGYPAPKGGYWKAYLPLAVSLEEASRINRLFPLQVREGQPLTSLGFASPIKENLLWFWLGEGHAEKRMIAEAGMLAIRRFEQEQRDSLSK